jgi:hypothetical protein
MVPETATKKTKAKGGVAVQENGLPEGVKILPVASLAPAPAPASATEVPAVTPAAETAPEAPLPEAPSPLPDLPTIVKSRSRIRPDAPTDDPDKPKRRKPGRPKAGRLDVPKTIGADAPATPAPLPDAPKLSPQPAPAPETPTPEPVPASPRRMSDIAPRRAAHSKPEAAPEPKSSKAKAKRAKHDHHHHVHKVGVPPLHFGAVMSASLRSRVRPGFMALAALAAVSFAALTGYGVWLYLTGGLPDFAGQLTRSGLQVLVEAALLALLYYIGRSIGQAAITYGIAREHDQRPVPLARQIGVGVNTFGRRLVLDVWFVAFELLLLGLMGGLILTGGSSWPVNPNLQLAAIFVAFLVLLYLQTGLALSRGLAAVGLTLTTQTPFESARLGWRMFSHRFELLGLRFLAAAMELVLALPLAAIAVGLIVAAPAGLHLATAFAAGLLALVAGSLFGAGTAAWWVSLYRRIVMADQPDHAATLLSGRQAAEARRGSLTFLVSVTTLLIAAVLALPWLKFF